MQGQAMNITDSSGNDRGCFGRFAPNARRCRDCEFRASCRLCTETESRMNHSSGLIGFENLSEWDARVADFDHIPGCEDDEESPLGLGVAGLAKFFRFLLSLDDYTIGLIEAAIAAKSRRGDTRSVQELAGLRHCSRQTMHRKIIDTMVRYPLLADLLRLTLRRISAGRARFRHRRTDGVLSAAAALA